MYYVVIFFKKENQGIAFIGPSAHAISGMGDKIESKKVAKEAGVHVIPGIVYICN